MKKKLIEVALPLEDINIASAREKSIRHGHPSTLHLWWARRPLATARAVLFASIVDDPSSHPEEFPSQAAQDQRRNELFDLIRELVKWENLNNTDVLKRAHNEMLRYTDKLPPVYDPFCGGGAIPIEAQRLGLTAYGSDLNPVAVLISKALTELPYPYSGKPPIHPGNESNTFHTLSWKGAAGLAEDVRYYGQWMRYEAEKRIGCLYPKVKLTDGQDTTTIAWIWARTVKCPNPACGCEMPLVRTWWLSKKKGKEVWVEPVTENGVICYEIKTGKGKPKNGTVNRRGATCSFCGSPVPFTYIRIEGKSKRIKQQMIAIVGEGINGRIYTGPSSYHVGVVEKINRPVGISNETLPNNTRDFKTPNYGMSKYSDLFTNRQLTAMVTFSDLVLEARRIVQEDATSAGFNIDDAKQYADVVAVYLSFAIDKLADRCSTICSWDTTRDGTRNTFARQAIPMVWDFSESNPFSHSSGNISNALEWIEKALQESSPNAPAQIEQANAMSGLPFQSDYIISTDPPYYDNIGYADLSDFFYIWLRRSLKDVFPDIFRTLLVPKADELIATPYRHDGDRGKAKAFFEDGLYDVFTNLHRHSTDEYPMTVYYAFKQTDSSDENEFDEVDDGNIQEASSGWETMLSSLIRSGFSITGTWPMRTEMSNRAIASESNALASSIVLACRKRPANAPIITRREFAGLLRQELSKSIREMQSGNIAPVDLSQAAIGPGMAVFSRYSQVIDAGGTPMSVRSALRMINQVLDAYLTEQEGELDSDSRLCVTIYAEYGLGEVSYGVIDVAARAKNASFERLSSAGVMKSAKGKVWLTRRENFTDDVAVVIPHGKNMVWLNTQKLAHILMTSSEQKAAEFYREMPGEMTNHVKALAYRLYAIAQQKGWTEEALVYNTLISSWGDVQRKVSEIGELRTHKGQISLDDL